MKGNVKAVDVAKFREEAKKFMDNEDYAYMVIRLAALMDVMCAKGKELLKRGTFPLGWIDIAATLSLRLPRGFDVAKFNLPKKNTRTKGQNRFKPAITTEEALHRIEQNKPEWIQ